MNDKLRALCVRVKEALNVSHDEHERIEIKTQHQSSQPDWHSERTKRITGSKCEEILCQKKKSVSLVSQCMYPKPLDPAPAPVAWERHYKAVAIQCYVFHMEKLGKHLYQYKIVPLLYTQEKDGLVLLLKEKWKIWVPSSQTALLRSNIYSKCEMTPEEGCNDPNFYCELVDSQLQLKLTHAYYHQVQLQLYVGTDLYHWCDFCIYTCKGLSVQRIHQNSTWQEKCIPKLESFYDECILPKLLLGKYKPRYILL